MKLLVIILTSIFAVTTFAQGSGDLDLTFSLDGKEIIEHNLGSTPPLSEGDESARALYVYPNGEMLIGGQAYHTNSENIDMVVTKLLIGGSIDTNWGNNGHAVVAFDRGGDNQDILHDIIVDQNGYILLIGESEYSGDDTDFAIARLTAGGDLDDSGVDSFAGNGILTVHFDNGGNNKDVAYSAEIVNNHLLVVGFATQSTGTDFGITRIIYDGVDDGVIDTNYGTNGRQVFDFSYSSNSIDKALKIVFSENLTGFWLLGSASESDGSESPALLKIDYSGEIDNRFSTDGQYVYPDSRAGSDIQAVAKKPFTDEFVFVGGDTHPEDGNLKDDCAISYLNVASTDAMGQPSSATFNFNMDPNPFLFDFNSDCNAVVFSESDLKMLISGSLYPDNLSSFSMGVMRFSSMNVTNGQSSYAIDTGFATSGKKAIAFNGSGQIVDIAYSIAVDNDKDVIVAGTATNQNAVNKVGVAKLIGEGGQDPTVTINSPTHGQSFTYGMPMSLTGTTSDPEDGTDVNLISWHSNIDGFLNNGLSISCPTNFACLSEGIHLITATVTDSDGQVDSHSIAIEILEVQNDPVVMISAPSDNDSFWDFQTINFVATATDDEDGDITGDIFWTSDHDGNLGTGGSIMVSNLTVATHTITANVFDSNNQSGFQQITIHVQEFQDAPTVMISSPSDNDSFLNTAAINFVASASDDEDGDITANIFWTSDHDGSLGTGGTISVTDLTVATHTITANIVDSNQQVGHHQITLNIQQDPDIIFRNGFE